MSVTAGAWPSPVTADVVVGASVGLGGPQVVSDRVWWAEARPHEGGRVQLVHRSCNGDDTPVDVLPDGFSARSRAHEYGGGAWWATPDSVVFTNATDQRLWRLNLDAAGVPAGDPVPVTAEPTHHASDRHADARPIGDGTWWVCVRERHADTGHPTDELVAVRTTAPDGQSTPDRPSTAVHGGQPVVLRNGADFVSNPRLSPDGRWLCWLEWNLPDMPWQSTTLWVAGVGVGADGAPQLVEPTAVLGAATVDGSGDVGGDPVSLSQPGWLPDGRLAVVSDDDNWWNLWTFTHPGRPEPGSATQLTVVAGELAPPQWVFGQSTWGVDDNGIVVGVWRADGHDHIGVVAAGDDEVHWVHSGHLSVDGLSVSGTTVALIAASFATEPEVTVIDTSDLLAAAVAGTRADMVVRRAPRDLGIDQSWWSVPEAVTFPTTDNKLAHALLYRPHNPRISAGGQVAGGQAAGVGVAESDAAAASGSGLPPLMVLIHGGPTSAARCQLSMGIQFWTTRGWAVVDVNYRGSTGYGRRYRNQLHHAWGVADVADCLAVASWLADTGEVDPDRMVIRGGSAGGFTALSALATADVFAAGVSAYGIADLEMLAAETHKFESGYNDWLLGSHADHPERWADRSPINHVDRLTSPLLVLQGTDDAVVPPSQSELIVHALRQRGVPVAYVLFDGEGHGFRSADTQRAALDAEQQFLGRVLGMTGDDRATGLAHRLHIHNLPPHD
jgi:dipeptidyl aminopeptidase/acylaminoacyl peptidase